MRYQDAEEDIEFARFEDEIRSAERTDVQFFTVILLGALVALTAALVYA